MTREEQIDWLCRLRADLNNGVIFTSWNKEFIEALNGFLEQKPCNDAISRQYLLNNCVVDKVTMPYVPISKIQEAPPIRAQEPTIKQSCENCKILELLVDMEIPTICEDDYNDYEYCEQNCNFKAPTKECYLHWAEHKRKMER